MGSNPLRAWIFFQVLFSTTRFSSVLSCEDLLISNIIWVFTEETHRNWLHSILYFIPFTLWYIFYSQSEDGRLFSDINDRNFISVFGGDQGTTFYTCHKNWGDLLMVFKVLFIHLAFFFLRKVVLIFVRETGSEEANNCLYLPWAERLFVWNDLRP